ncbi:GntP family permease [Cellulomonas cellasea]|uniref:Gluconate transporter n=2 Tax=Cellulomonas cellasea TaxID=43670 RepID=A0A0A0B6Z4_9CELL|nr:SLC13 family permease [Cellulomonas cellasea]KGM01958.1 gluconate transporter [Cellulomonas cellasea DSM 20118]GEA86109.1 gluconate permease [Cellulomonas cellasea]
MVALHTAVAIVLAIGLIIRFKVNPVISLILASLYLGLASGVGFAGTIEAITVGFGEIMTEVGLLIGFGVLIGALLHSTGAFQRMVRVLVRAVGATRLPYAMATLLSTILPSIYVDVQVVLASPVARSASPHVGRNGLPLMASALGAGIFAGYVFVIPGLAAISIAGLLDIPLGRWLLYGIVIGPLTAVLTSLVMRLVLRGGFWKPESDEEVDDALVEQEAHAAAGAEEPSANRPLPLWLMLLPILVPLVMIGFGAFADLLGFATPLVEFVGDANVALFVGLLGAYLLSRRTAGRQRTDDALDDGFHTTGEILLITGVGGSLGAVITRTDLDQVLAGLFQADAGAPVLLSVLLAWFIAALLHLAIGSVSVAAITAAGIIAPVLTSLDVAPIVIGLAIASGAMFALQVNSNFFWMFKALLGLSTKGSLKTLTLGTSIASAVSLPMVLVVSLFA